MTYHPTIDLVLDIGNNGDPVECTVTAAVYIPYTHAPDDYPEVTNLTITDTLTDQDITDQASPYDIELVEESLNEEVTCLQKDRH